MRKIILYTAVTIDGLIARKDGAVDWLDAYSRDPQGDDYGYADFISTIDATIMGYSTYQLAEKLDGMAAMAGFTNYVCTRKKRKATSGFVTFLSGDVIPQVRTIKEQKGQHIWLLGGGQINSLLASAGLIDEMILTTIPLVLGEGIPLFAQPGVEATFTLVSTKSYSNGLTQSTYARTS